MLHGTRSCYQIHHCRCEPCRLAQRDYHRRHAKGLVQPRRSAQEAQRRLQAWQAAGVGLHRLSVLSGLSRRTLQRIVQGRYQTIREDVEARILGLQQAPLADGQLAPLPDSYQTRERLRRLIEEQYPMPWLQARFSPWILALARVSEAKNARPVKVKTWRRVATVYARAIAEDLDGVSC